MYQNDLALIHHLGFGDFTRRATPGLLAILRASGLRRGRILDLGCGSGIWLARLSRAGYEAFGIDRSPAMIAIARKTVPRATLTVGSVFSTPLPACDAVTSMGEVLSYLPARGRPSLPRLFKNVAAALSPRGLFVFDLLVTSPGPPMAYRLWKAGETWAVLSEGNEQPARKRLTREITTFRKVGSDYRRTFERHVLRVSSRLEIERALRAAGFSVRVSRRYGSFELLPRRLVFRARKR